MTLTKFLGIKAALDGGGVERTQASLPAVRTNVPSAPIRGGIDGKDRDNT